VWLQENPNCFVEIKLVTDTYIDAKVKRALYQAHDGILAIIPEGSKLISDQEETKANIDLNKDIKELFQEYFRYQKGQEPNQDILNILNEVLDIEEE
jgi:DNA repair protein SbcD/Mre11